LNHPVASGPHSSHKRWQHVYNTRAAVAKATEILESDNATTHVFGNADPGYFSGNTPALRLSAMSADANYSIVFAEPYRPHAVPPRAS
jgi:hypothetical protein